MRKRILLFFCFVTGFFSFQATTFTWSPQFGQSASTTGNWLPVIAGVPGAADDVIFDGTSTVNCVWDIPTISSFSVLSGYTGNIDMQNFIVTIAGNMVISSGSVL